MKRGTFLKKLSALLGVAAAAPTVLATGSKPEEKKSLMNPETGKFKFAQPSRLWMPFVIHTEFLTIDYTTEGKTFILPLSDNQYQYGDVIFPDPEVRYQLYVHGDPTYDINYKCWNYEVSLCSPPYITEVPRKYLMPGTLYARISHAKPTFSI